MYPMRPWAAISELEPRSHPWGQAKENRSQLLDSEVTKKVYVSQALWGWSLDDRGALEGPPSLDLGHGVGKAAGTGTWGLGSQGAWRDEGRSREGPVRMVRRSRRQKLRTLAGLCRQEEGLRVRGWQRRGRELIVARNLATGPGLRQAREGGRPEVLQRDGRTDLLA